MPPGISQLVSGQSPISDSTPVAITPLYSAPMMLPDLPSCTKNVPMIEVRMHMPEIASG